MGLGGKKKDYKNEKIEVTLTESGIIMRLVFMVLALSVAAYAFYYIFTKVLHTESGWQTLSVKTESGLGNEFIFHYQLGVSGVSPSTEWGRLNKLYPSLLDRGANIFGKDEVAGLGNLYTLNSRPNEEVYIEPALYEALLKVNESKSRFIYYAPVYAVYKSLFACDNDYAASFFDPFQNEEIAAYIEKLMGYVGDEKHVKLELLGDNRGRLTVSDEYLTFAKENEIPDFLDFYYAKNAFVIDYVAEELMAKGYKAGVLSSVEGFIRALGEGEYTTRLFYYHEGMKPDEEVYTYNGPQSLVALRDYEAYEEEGKYYYLASDGSRRHIYLDPETGLCRDGEHQTFEKSENLGCSELFLKMYDEFCKGKRE